MARTTKFKQTDIGPIPEDWDVRRLGDCATMFAGGTPSSNVSAYYGGVIPWATISDISQTSKYISQTSICLSDAGFNHSSAKWYPGNTLLFAMYASIGKCCISLRPITSSQAILGIYNLKGIDLEYLYYILGFRNSEFASMGQTGTQSNLSKSLVENVEVATPPTLSEQKRIAESLSDLDELISAYDDLIKKKTAIKLGAMQELLTGKRRLPGFSGKWVEKRIGDLLSIGNGRDYKHLESGDVPVYGTGGLMAHVNDWLVEGPTVCIGRKGTIDRPQYHDGKIWTVDTLFYTFDFKGISPKFLYYLFTRIDWMSYNTATGVPSITAKSICDIFVSTPPTLVEQKAIAEVLSDMDGEIAVLEEKREKTRKIKQGMMQELLTGRVRLEVA